MENKKGLVYVIPPVPKMVQSEGVFAGFADSAGHANQENKGIKTISPVIPKDVYDNLPKTLKESTDQFKTDREKDVFLTGAITILSGCFPSIYGFYDGDKVFNPLFSFIVAPAASGKGVLNYSKKLGNAIHNEIKNDKGAVRDSGTRQKMLFIPGNCSSAAMLQQLQASSGVGIICETEADTLNSSLKQDWGNYSDCFRKAFHHESISSLRKTETEYIEIENPKIAIALSGTQSQVTGLIPAVENGLFSRFIFYTFDDYQEFRNPFDAEQNDLGEHFDQKSKEILNISEFIKNNPSEFKLTPEQQKIFHDKFKSQQKKICSEYSNEANSVVMRMGLITFRLAMVLSVLRKFEDTNTESELICSDLDFETSLKLSDAYFKHNLQMLEKLPKNSTNNNAKMNELLQNMTSSKEMRRGEIVEIGKRLGIGTRTIDEYLRKAESKGLLKRLSQGKYMKI
jgi:hypothetical protein